MAAKLTYSEIAASAEDSIGCGAGLWRRLVAAVPLGHGAGAARRVPPGAGAPRHRTGHPVGLLPEAIGKATKVLLTGAPDLSASVTR